MNELGKIKIEKSVDEYLNDIDYEEINNYKPSKFAINYINFLKVISTEAGMNKSPPVHYKMIDGLCSKKQYLANLCSRGLSKTTLFAEILFLYLAVFRHIPEFGEVSTAIYVADSMENGAKSLRKNIESRWQKSEYLQKLLPEIKFTDAYIEFNNAAGEKFGLRLFGAKSHIRGIKIFGQRPVLAILDDLVSDDDANSPTLLAKIKDNIYKSVIPALDPNKRKIVFNGTPFNKSDPLYQAIESGGWHVNVYPVCEKFPCTRKEFKGAWEDRFSYDAINDQYKLYLSSGQIKAFRQELMLRIASEEDRVIDDDDIQWFDSVELLQNPQKYNFYITSDFATSTNKKADYTVIGVWALDHKENRYLVDGAIGRQLMSKTFEDLFGFVEKYKPFSVGLEISGQQGGFISLIRKEMIDRKLYFNIAKTKGSNKEGVGVKTNKMERFRISEPFFKQRKIYLPRDKKDSMLVQEILEELSLVTIDGIKSTHDDAIDMISQLDQIYLTYPTEHQANLKNPSELQDNIFNDSTENLSGYGYDSYLV